MSTASPKTGKNPKLTPGLQSKIINLIKQGNYPDVASQACGIKEDIYKSWEKLAIKGKFPYAGLFAAIKHAHANAETELLAGIKQVGDGGAVIERRTINHAKSGNVEVIERFQPAQFQPKAWLLERTRPGRYAETKRTEVDLMVHKGIDFIREISRARERRVAQAIEGEAKQIQEQVQRALPAPVVEDVELYQEQE